LRHKTIVLRGVWMLTLGLGGCGDLGPPASTLTPSPTPTVVVVPPQTAVFPPALTNVSLSGVVYELTPTGRTPIPLAYVYCETCSKETHMFARADEKGFYQFSGDIASGGGIWLIPGVPTELIVGLIYNPDFEDPPGFTPRRGPGRREVLIDGDTRLDIELVRR
jgi:hypothetical protein